MNAAAFAKFRLGFTLTVAVVMLSLLVWQHLHGGVPRHSFLARADYPSISNWWGALLLPLLTFVLVGRMQARVTPPSAHGDQPQTSVRGAMAAFVGALLYGGALATAFATGHPDISSQLFTALPLIGLLLPIYRAEYVLGFVFGLTYTFGAVLPTVIATGAAAVSAILHVTIRRGITWLVGLGQRHTPANG